MKIYPILRGGLGNQLFQIAAAASVAKIFEAECLIPLRTTVSLGQGNQPLTYKNTIYKKLKVGYPSDKAIPVFERKRVYKPIVLPKAKEVVLRGYWQSYKYWNSRDEVLDLFDFGEYYKIDIGAIHIRGGDFLAKKAGAKVCTKQYYERAMAMVPGDKVVITDDVEYATDLGFGDLILPGNRTDEEDLKILRSARYLIGSNSSFSWWGAMLGRQEMRIFPNRWFDPNNGPEPYDLMPLDWTTIKYN